MIQPVLIYGSDVWGTHDRNVRNILYKLSAISLWYFPSRWNQGVAVLTSLSSLEVPCVVVTTYGAAGDGGIVGLTTFCFQRSTDKIFTHIYTEIVASLKCTWYFCIFVLFCLNKFFTVYHYSTLSLFSLKAGGRRVDGFFVAVGIVICCRSTNCGATGGAVSLRIFCFSELD